MTRSRGKKVVFLCQQCGNESPKWQGRCPFCDAWNSYTEVTLGTFTPPSRWLPPEAAQARELAQVSSEELPRMVLPFTEVNRVLGGGIVPGSLTLVAGDPGIGKSTLLLQLSAAVAREMGRVLYVSGEESAHQVKMRAERLGISGKGIYFLAETDLDTVIQQLEQLRPAMVVVDSIQTVHRGDIPSEAGSIPQVRECARQLTQWAKARSTPVFLVGHVTKEGAVAGPRVLEHMVDVVLYLEGESLSPLRLLRGVKNRFGSTNEVGVFQMENQGLVEVEDPSRALLAERHEGTVGSAIVPTLEGSRPLLVEIQALTTPSLFTPPRRTCNGVDFNRLLLVTAVLTKRLRFPLGSQDVMVNIVGGLKVGEPAADLGMALALASSLKDSPVHPSLVVLGEVGLSGELRPVPQAERRLKEAAKLGFRRALLPYSLRESLDDKAYNLELLYAETLGQALKLGIAPRGRED